MCINVQASVQVSFIIISMVVIVMNQIPSKVVFISLAHAAIKDPDSVVVKVFHLTKRTRHCRPIRQA